MKMKYTKKDAIDCQKKRTWNTRGILSAAIQR